MRIFSNVKKPFMEAEWKDLLVVSFACNPKQLTSYLPKNLSLDLYHGNAIISWVAFRFKKAKLFGLRIPFHQNFPEINLRTYVIDNKTKKKGVLFIKEIAPKNIVALIANKMFNEPFFYGNVKYKKEINPNKIKLNYIFNIKNINEMLTANVETNKKEPSSKLEKFIIKRHLAFTKQKDNSFKIYQIKRKPWYIYKSINFKVDEGIKKLFPKNLESIFNTKPLAIFLLDGSAVKVFK